MKNHNGRIQPVPPAVAAALAKLEAAKIPASGLTLDQAIRLEKAKRKNAELAAKLKETEAQIQALIAVEAELHRRALGARAIRAMKN